MVNVFTLDVRDNSQRHLKESTAERKSRLNTTSRLGMAREEGEWERIVEIVR